MYEIKQVVGEDIFIRYEELKEKLEEALEYSSGEWTAVQLAYKAISEPTVFQLWEVLKDNCPVAIGATRFVQYNNFSAMHITAMAGDTNGDLIEWSSLFEKEIKKYPQVDCLEYTGRRGFVKQLEKAGWTERYTTMRKSLKESLKI